ncbi:MAG: tetratricopeptide repeat protein [Acidobacteriota bacterium]
MGELAGIDQQPGSKPLIGQTVGHYRIEEKLGAGGMSVVYRAVDVVLHRPVAVKFLLDERADSADARARFLREARTASALNHPNICTIHELGEFQGRAYIVMELLEGETLEERLGRGPLSPEEALETALQLGRGLQFAHSKGILHRDIKPANIVLTVEGQVKILDFGIAKLLAGTEDQAPTELTQGQGVIGTVAYMSPEQALGKPLDCRSDLFSLGVVLYEMLSGHHPFRRETLAATLTAILNYSPEELGRESGDDRLRAGVTRLLEKDPDRRYITAAEWIDDLELSGSPSRPRHRGRRSLPRLGYWLSGTATLLALALLLAVFPGGGFWGWRSGPARTPGAAQQASTPRPIVAVLPLQGLDGESSTRQIGLGLAHTLVTSLSAIDSLTMIPASATLGYEGVGEEASRAAGELGATYVVTGVIQSLQDRLHVTINLVRGNSVVWGGEVEGTRADLFALQHQLAEELAGALKVALTERERQRLDTPPTRNREAFADYTQGRAFLERPDVEGNVTRAIGLFEAAVAKDPAFSLAHAGLGEARWAMYEKTGEASWIERAREAIQEALRIDADQAGVRYSLALIQRGTGRRREAIQELRGAIALQPNRDDFHRLLGRLLAEESQMEEAVSELQQAIRYRPSFWGNYRALGFTYFRRGRFEEAIEAFQRVTELQPDLAWGFQYLGLTYHSLGDLDRAVENYQKAIQVGPSPGSYSNLGTIFYRRGDYEAAARNYEQARKMRPRHAVTRRNLGDTYRKLGREAEARSAYLDAIELLRDQLRVNPADARALSLVALLEAKLGRREEAERHSTQAAEVAPRDGQVLYRKAVVHALATQKKSALGWLKKALEQGYSVQEAIEDEDLTSIRDSAAYRQLVRKTE